MGAAILDANTQKVNKQQNVNKPGLEVEQSAEINIFCKSACTLTCNMPVAPAHKALLCTLAQFQGKPGIFREIATG